MDVAEVAVPLSAPRPYRTPTLLVRLREAALHRLQRRPWLLVRLLAVLSVPLLGLWMSAPPRPWVLLALTAWVVVSALPRSPVVPTAIDAALGAAIVFLTGDVVTPYLLYVLSAVAGAGIAHGGGAGALAGMVVSLSRVAAMVTAGTLGRQSDELLLSSLSVLPLAGLAAGMTMEVLRRRRSGRAVLEEANQLLVDLHRVTGAIPGGMDVATVAGAALAEIRSIGRPAVALVFSGDSELLRPAAPSDLLTSPVLYASQLDRVLGTAAYRLCTPAVIRDHIGELGDEQAHWLLVPLRSRGSTVGAFVVGYTDLATARRCRRELVSLAGETALALDNARLLGATTARAADVARRRIAHDLHDSVAQSLAHLKMELELLAMSAEVGSELGDETTRLARVASRALEDVRATITGLRTHVVEDGLVPALRSHVEDLQSHGGPRLSFESAGKGTVDPVLAPDLFRVAQEAVSNAVRHSRARTVVVSVEIDNDTIELVVEDDGVGISAGLPDGAGRGLGLRAMQDRAAAIGGELTVRPRVGGGTVVMLRAPTRPAVGRRRQQPDPVGRWVRR